MSSVNWARLEDLFHRAAALAPVERSAFLDAECAGDALLRSEIESLLAHDASPGSGFQSDVEQAAEALARQNSESMVDRRIGAYRVTGLIGEGGMGAVYRAVRDDDQYSKSVAVKLVRHGSETRALLERFREERQILASLEHPYIGRLLDGGVAFDGLPYLVMELVEGVPITQYAAEHALAAEGRLRLFQKVCEAVRYAHSKLVVHRDLKPGNILITADGTPKLLDFGIAKLLTDASQPAAEFSRTMHLLTPNYASPEQVRGHVTSVATDIYSLGAVLYELLAGRPAHQVESNSPAEIERAICTVEPAAPSQTAGLADVPPRSLTGDLDNIILMALRKDPDRRYRSVEQFSEDIARYLNGRPVIARADTFTYRASKFLRRNWLPVGAATVACLGLTGGALGFAWQAHRAEQRFAQVRKLANTVLFDIHDRIVNLPGSTPARQVIVRTSLEYLSSLSADASSDPGLQAELAEAYRRVGDVQGDPLGSSLGDAKGALESYRRAVDLYSRAAQARPNDLALQNAFAQALLHLGYRQYANADGAGARRSYSEASRHFDAVLLRDGSQSAALEGSAQAFTGLSRVLIDENDYRGAATQASKAVDITRRLAAAEPSNLDRRDLLAGSLNQLGSCLVRTGELAKEVETYRSYVQIREQLARADPENAARRRSLMIAYSRLGEVLGAPESPNIGDVADARIQFQKMLDIAEPLAAVDPANKTGQMDLVQANYRMGAILRQDQPNAALPYLRKARDLATQLAAADPHTLAIQAVLGVTEADIGAILASRGELAEGIARMRRGIAIDRALIARKPNAAEYRIATLIAASELARALAHSRDRLAMDALVVEASPILDWVHKTRLSSFVAARRPLTLFAFGQAYAQLGDRAQACVWFGQSVEAWRAIEASPAGISPVHRAFQTAAIREFESCKPGK